jgi:hypothetical protein
MLITDGTYEGTAQAMVVNGSDVYAAIFERTANTTPVIKLWKNGQTTLITDGTNTAVAYTMAVSGADVYIAGYEFNSQLNGNQAKIWKNGVATTLTTGTQTGVVQSMVVVGKFM